MLSEEGTLEAQLESMKELNRSVQNKKVTKLKVNIFMQLVFVVLLKLT